MGVSRDVMCRLLNGRASLTPRVAIALERIGWSNADFWVRVQARHDFALALSREVRRMTLA